MDPGGVVCLLACVGGFVALLAYLLRRKPESQTDPLQIVADELGGEVLRSQEQGLRFVRFERRGIPHLVCFYLHGVWITSLEACTPSEHYLDLLSRGSDRLPPDPPGSLSVEPNDADFRIRSDAPDWARGLLAGGLRRFAQDFTRAALAPIHVRLTRNRLILEAEVQLLAVGVVSLARAMDRLIELLQEYAHPAGIEILESKSGEEGGVCQVCSASLDGRVVRCRVCRTPHHEDCWEYMGRCSTYGCTSRSLE